MKNLDWFGELMKLGRILMGIRGVMLGLLVLLAFAWLIGVLL